MPESVTFRELDDELFAGRLLLASVFSEVIAVTDADDGDGDGRK